MDEHDRSTGLADRTKDANAVTSPVSLIGRLAQFDLPGKWSGRFEMIIFVVILTLVCLDQFSRRGFELYKWDVLLVSGLAILIVGIWLAMDAPDRMDKAISRLIHREALQGTPGQYTALKTDLQDRANLWALLGGFIVAGAIAAAFLIAYGWPLPMVQVPLTIVEIMGGWIAGRYLGRMASYGRLSASLQKHKVNLTVKPGHLDGAAGFKPIGQFYFYQAMILSIPAIYLAVWWLLIPVWNDGRYARWQTPYLGLLPLAIAFEVLAFVVPIYYFHREMQHQKTALLAQADTLSQGIIETQAQLAQLQDAADRDLLEKQLAHMIEQYWRIEHMPTWPVDPKTRRRFTVNNLSLLVPFIGNFMSGTSTWQDLVQTVFEFMSK